MPKQIPDVPSAVSPLGPYSTVTEAGGLVFISGQVAIDPATDTRIEGDVRAQTIQVMENLGLGYLDIAKTTIFLADMADFPVVNEVYGGYFADEPPARSTIEAGALPGGFLVEIEAIAAR